MLKRIVLFDRFLFVDKTRLEKSRAIWNAVFSLMSALQSIVYLLFTTRICGENDAGILSLAFSIAYLMIMVGNYGVRNYHATDINRKFSFSEYAIHRIITCILMVVGTLIYCFCCNYSSRKLVIIWLITLLKFIESVEDVIHGAYQQYGRLDTASKIGTIRLFFSIITFAIWLVFSRDLIQTLIAAVSISIGWLIINTLYSFRLVGISIIRPHLKGIIGIFKVCFPLFMASFFNMYICNASKYAIDIKMTDLEQGYYGMIYMPVFVINLLSMCIYRPHLVELAQKRENKDIEFIKKFVVKQFGLISVVSLVVVGGGYLLGGNVLSFIYGIDLVWLKKN